MNTATGTRKEDLSDDERADRKRGMKLVTESRSPSHFRIAMSPELVDSFHENSNARRQINAPANNDIGSSLEEYSSPKHSGIRARTVPIAITLTIVALTGVIVGYLLRRDRE